MDIAGVTYLGNRYRLGPVVRRSTAVDVHEAWDERLERPVDVEVLHDQTGLDDVVRARFRRETQAASRLSHPNVVGLLDRGEEAGRPYVVTEPLRGRSLDSVLHGHTFRESTALGLAADVCAGLQHAHDHGLIHGCMDTSSIVVTTDGTAKVGEFGLARVAVATGEIVHGHLAYIAPEQIDGDRVDARADVYAAGVVLYRMLTGGLPFEGSPATMTLQKRHSSPRRPRIVDPSISVPAEVITLTALAREPGARYPSARAMLTDLTRVAQLPDASPVAHRP